MVSDAGSEHEAVLKRLNEVASAEYPFEKPEFIKPQNRDERINLKSTKNVRPLLRSLFLLLCKIFLPVMTILFAIVGFYLRSKMYDLEAKVVLALSLVCAVPILSDPFFLHFVSNGLLGGLGRGDGAKTVNAGFFCGKSRSIQIIKDRMQKFVKYRPTPYFFSGDILTLMPFLLFKGSKGGKVPYQRYWVRVPSAPAPDGEDGPSKTVTETEDDEAVALDIVFPKEGYQKNKPTFLILHGLNGGSTEPYVLDLARRATKEGHTVAVMVNRGLMKTPLKGDESFHGARTSDVSAAVSALLFGLGGEKRTSSKPKTQIVLVGFSMGGIIAANYAAKSKEYSGLAGALSFSGTLCSEKMLLSCPSATVSLSVWQPLLAWGLKATIIKPNMPKFAKRALLASDVEKAKTVMDIDADLVTKYHGYSKVQDYYQDMSAGGSGDKRGLERLKGTKIPLLVVHAIDDPIAIYEVTLADKIAETESVMLLATKHGGHIGWPQGLFPSKNRWKFMMDVAMDFAASVAK